MLILIQLPSEEQDPLTGSPTSHYYRSPLINFPPETQPSSPFSLHSFQTLWPVRVPSPITWPRPRVEPASPLPLELVQSPDALVQLPSSRFTSRRSSWREPPRAASRPTRRRPTRRPSSPHSSPQRTDRTRSPPRRRSPAGMAGRRGSAWH